MNDNPADELRTLVDKLTLPHEVKVTHRGAYLHTRQDPPMLTQLRALCVSTIGPGNDNGTNQRHARTTLNIQASTTYTTIENRIRRWALNAGYNRPTTGWPTPERLLRTWHSLTYLKTGLNTLQYASTLRGWTEAITNLQDPPHRWDINRPCPICRAHILQLDIDGEPVRVRALTALERDPDLYRITCRSCGNQWDGLDACEELAQELTTKAVPVIQEAR